METNRELEEIKERLSIVEAKLVKRPSPVRNFLLAFGIVFFLIWVVIGVVQFISAK